MQHLRGGHVSVASKQVISFTTEQKAVCFVSVADRGLRPKNRLQKAKTPARWLALSGSGPILPRKYYTLEFPFCQWKIAKIGGDSEVRVKTLRGTPRT